MGTLISFGIFLSLLTLGWLAGSATERRHFRDLQQRAHFTSDILVTQIKSFPLAASSQAHGERPPKIIVQEVVIASDYLKSFLAGLRNIFGGEVGSFQSMLERARNEATQRLLDQAKSEGYNAVCNLRLERADVGGSTASKKNAMAAIIASGTAYVRT